MTHPAALLIGLSVLTSAISAQRLFERQAYNNLPARQRASQSVFHGDLNGDGLEDFVIGSRYSTLHDPRGGVWINQGQGRFKSVFDLSSWEMIYGLADLDGDGDLDILTDRSILQNNGQASFSVQTHSRLPTRSGVNYDMQRAIVDLDGNGWLDVCFLTKVYHDFQSPTPRVTQLPNTNDDPAIVALGDVDGDGDQDLVFALRFGPSVTRLFSNDGTGKFTEVTATTMPITRVVDAEAVMMVDLDLDGDLDILVGGKVHGYFVNDGKGKFSDGTALVGTFDDCLELDVGDINGDGMPDIVVGGIGTGHALLHANGKWLQRQSWPHGNRTTTGIALIDLDGDKDLDLVQACGKRVTSGDNESEDHLFFNDGKGKFFDSSQRYHKSGSGFVALGDMNGDGFVDVFHGETGEVFLGDSQASFSRRIQNSGRFRGQRTPMLGDLDNDGDLDLIFDSDVGGGDFQVGLNNGGGYFLAGGSYLPSPSAISSMWVLADLDQDGDLDIFAGTGHNTASGPYPGLDSIWINDGTGSFSQSKALPSVLTASTAATAADLDQDGDIDIAIGDGVYWRQANGTYTFTGVASVYWRPSQALAKDLDGDGRTDLLFVDRGMSSGCSGHTIFWNQGGGQFTPGSVGHMQGPLSSIAAGDIDGDGKIDLVVGSFDFGCAFGHARPPENRIYLNLGNRRFEDLHFSSGPRRYPMSLDGTNQVFLTDLDGDGDLDLYAHNKPIDNAPRSKVFVNVQRHLLAPYPSSIGRDFEMALHGAKQGGILFVGFSEASHHIPGFGRFGLDPNAILHVASLAAPATGRVATWQTRIPVTPAAIGTELYWQALVIDGVASLTNVLKETVRGL